MTEKKEINLITHSDRIERLLAPLKPVIGQDLEGYRNHIYRVLTYAMHFLRGDLQYQAAIEVALVYHDVGLWTARNLAYLGPSETAAQRANEMENLGIDPELLFHLIHWHHKLMPYSGPHADAINALRKADWVDATQGRIRKGLSREQITVVEAAIPKRGFHETLNRLAADLNHGRQFRGLLQVLRNVYKL